MDEEKKTFKTPNTPNYAHIAWTYAQKTTLKMEAQHQLFIPCH